jgi:hypothetical protein
LVDSSGYWRWDDIDVFAASSAFGPIALNPRPGGSIRPFRLWMLLLGEALCSDLPEKMRLRPASLFGFCARFSMPLDIVVQHGGAAKRFAVQCGALASGTSDMPDAGRKFGAGALRSPHHKA